MGSRVATNDLLIITVAIPTRHMQSSVAMANEIHV